MVFENRQEAGKLLAAELAQYGSAHSTGSGQASSPQGKNEQPIILALPRGGIPIGLEIAGILHAPLQVIVARKIGAPYNPEFGIGAISEGNVRVLDEPTIKFLRITKEELEEAISREEDELKRRVALYRNNKPLPVLKNRTVILVDDGLATGVTARAAIDTIIKHKPKRLILAAGVCASETLEILRLKVDAIVCVITPHNLGSIGLYYRDFPQVTDEEVMKLLKQSKNRQREGRRGN